MIIDFVFKKMFKFIYNKLIRPSQVRIRVNIINNLEVNSILDVGAGNGNLKQGLDSRITYTGIDIEPKSSFVLKNSIKNYNPGKKFDIVCAFAVLEHLTNPVEAIKKLKELSNNYILISVPYEPYYTISRFFIQEKEHYWTIYSKLLKHYLGKPIFEMHIHCGREYMGLYENKYENK